MNLEKTLFWTEKDLQESSELSSKDPLGTENFATQLAESILPGLTTLTKRIRYVTLICLWLEFIKTKLQEENPEKFMEYIKNFEKLTAYCIVSEYGYDEKRQTASLLGKTFAADYINEHPSRFSINNRDYPFLRNHGIQGAFGNYKVLARALNYMDEVDDFAVTGDGRDLINNITIENASFIRKILSGDAVPAKNEKFRQIAQVAGLSNFSRYEKKKLKKAIFSDGSRKCCFELLKKYYNPNSEFQTLCMIAASKSGDMNKRVVIDRCKYIVRFESLNREAHYIFFSLLNCSVSQRDIRAFVSEKNISVSLKELTGIKLDDFLFFHEKNRCLLPDTYDDSPHKLFTDLKAIRNNKLDCVRHIVAHHVSNQKRKNKAEWVDRVKNKFNIYEMDYKTPEEIVACRDSVIHSYRTANARGMIDELGI